MKPRRPNMPLGVKLAACLIAMGFHPEDAARAAGIKLPKAHPGAIKFFRASEMELRMRLRIDFDHDPALGIRIELKDGWDPHANDPRFISPMGRVEHARKSKADTTAAAKVKRLVRKNMPGFDYGVLDGLPVALGRKRAWPKGRKIAKRAK